LAEDIDHEGVARRKEYLESKGRSLTISGDLGSGKSTVARLLAEDLGWKLIATGPIQRQLATDLGVDTLELNRRAEANPSFDRYIDGALKALGRHPDHIIVESRMAFLLLSDTLNVYLYCDERIAAERIFAAGRRTERYRDLADALDGVRSRRASETQRFRRCYGVDIDDLRNYDCVIDTSFASALEVASLLKGIAQGSAVPAGAFICPQSLIPQWAIEDLIERVRTHNVAGRVPAFHSAAVRLSCIDREFYVIEGHDRVEAAVLGGEKWVSAAIVAYAENSARALRLTNFGGDRKRNHN